MMKLCVAFLLCVVLVVEGRDFRHHKQKSSEKREYNQQALLNSNLRCHGKDNGCCTVNNPCDVGDGDCARDLVCGSNNCPFGEEADDCCMQKKIEYPQAQCAQNKWVHGDGEGGSDDYIGAFSTQEQCINACMARRKSELNINGCTYRRKSYSSDNYCYVEYDMNSVYEGSAHKFQTCYLPYLDASQLRCQGAWDGCCTKETPCALNDGECYNNDQCAGNLICGSGNCAG